MPTYPCAIAASARSSVGTGVPECIRSRHDGSESCGGVIAKGCNGSGSQPILASDVHHLFTVFSISYRSVSLPRIMGTMSGR